MAALASNSSSISTKWAWYDDDQWREYDDHMVREIENCIRDGTMEVRMTFGANEYVIDLDTMTQTNVFSQFKRMIKCSEIAPGSDFECSWQWLDQNDWQVFTPAYMSQINTAFLQKETSVDVTYSNGFVYEVNFERMVQTNKTSGFTRRIRQHITLSDAAMANQPEDPDHQCPICMESTNLDAMILPCCHVVCRRCAKRLEMSGKCWCRGPIRYVQIGRVRPIFADR